MTNDKAGAAHPRLGPTSSRVTSIDVAVRNIYICLLIFPYMYCIMSSFLYKRYSQKTSIFLRPSYNTLPCIRLVDVTRRNIYWYLLYYSHISSDFGNSSCSPFSVLKVHWLLYCQNLWFSWKTNLQHIRTHVIFFRYFLADETKSNCTSIKSIIFNCLVIFMICTCFTEIYLLNWTIDIIVFA